MLNKTHSVFTHYTTVLALLALLLCQISTAHADTNVRASVDRNQVSSEETFSLSLTADSILFSGEPDVTALEKDFHIINRQQSSRTNIVNGKVNSSRQWDYTLVAKREGTLTIPALPMGKYTTRPITITVSEATDTRQAGNESIYLESDITPRDAYVQQELQYTVKIFTSVNILDASLEAPEVGNAVIEARGEERYQTLINGRYFQVIERRYAIYPQTSGTLTIPALTLQARVEGYRPSMLDPGRLVVKRSGSHRVKVSPPPAEFNGSVFLPAREVVLEETWSKNPDTLKVGDSITRTINIKADGLLGSQLPALPIIDLKNAKLYPDQAKIEKSEDKSRWTGIRSESLAVIPTRAGEFVLPEVRIAWWNTYFNRTEFAVLAERKFIVAPAIASFDNSQVSAMDSRPENGTANSNNNTPSDIEPPASKPFIWLVIAILSLSNIGFAFVWWRGRQRAPSATVPSEDTYNSEDKAFKLLVKSVKAEVDHRQLRHALTHWGGCHFKRAMTLNALGKAIPKISDFCQQLDAHLFSGQDINIDANAILVILKEEREAAKAKRGPHSALAPLYQD
ncbi:BatD family protein [Zhongshania sp.]|jgi:hypothetical protein|uniref:BatD family protein n=1 Tax=Zhongshania sp. TaxID=1971902 RepID=UPI0039E578F2